MYIFVYELLYNIALNAILNPILPSRRAGETYEYIHSEKGILLFTKSMISSKINKRITKFVYVLLNIIRYIYIYIY